MSDTQQSALAKSTTPTPKAAGNDRYEEFLDRWREKAERVNHYDMDYLCNHDRHTDPGKVLRSKAMGDLLQDVGKRYHKATLESFAATTPEQQAAIGLVRGYLATLDAHVEAGVGLILYGPCGTGKDHLAVGAGRVAIGMGCTVGWQSAQTIFSDFRDSFSDDSGYTEAELMKRLTQPDILILSDPVPAHGAMTDFQGNILYRLVNARYGEQKPTWTTLNAADVGEARRRVGAATIDRLTQGATVVFCNWPTFREPKTVG